MDKMLRYSHINTGFIGCYIMNNIQEIYKECYNIQKLHHIVVCLFNLK